MIPSLESSRPWIAPFAILVAATLAGFVAKAIVVLSLKSYPDRGAVIHEFVKRAHERFRPEGIEIPFPQRVVHLHPAKA